MATKTPLAAPEAPALQPVEQLDHVKALAATRHAATAAYETAKAALREARAALVAGPVERGAALPMLSVARARAMIPGLEVRVFECEDRALEATKAHTDAVRAARAHLEPAVKALFTAALARRRAHRAETLEIEREIAGLVDRAQTLGFDFRFLIDEVGPAIAAAHEAQIAEWQTPPPAPGLRPGHKLVEVLRTVHVTAAGEALPPAQGGAPLHRGERAWMAPESIERALRGAFKGDPLGPFVRLVEE